MGSDTEGSHMAWTHDCMILCYRTIVYRWHGFLATVQSSIDSCMHTAIESSGNLKIERRCESKWFGFVEIYAFVGRLWRYRHFFCAVDKVHWLFVSSNNRSPVCRLIPVETVWHNLLGLSSRLEKCPMILLCVAVDRDFDMEMIVDALLASHVCSLLRTGEQLRG